MEPEILKYVEKANLNDHELHLLNKRPCEINSSIIKLISPNPDSADFVEKPKPQNSFFLYRKNFILEHKSHMNGMDGRALSKEAKVSWEKETDEVKSYFKVLGKLPKEKNEEYYRDRSNEGTFINNGDSSSTSQYSNNNTSSSDQQPEIPQIDNAILSSPILQQPVQQQNETNDNNSCQELELNERQEDNNNSEYELLRDFYSSHNKFFPFLGAQQQQDDHFTNELDVLVLQQNSFYESNNNDHTVLLSSTHPYTFSPPSPNFMAQESESQQNQ